MGHNILRKMSFIVFFFSAAAVEANIEISNWQLQSKERVSRTDYQYTYTADATNTSTKAAQNVSATLSSFTSNTQVIEGDIAFGDIASGATKTSLTTFVIQQDRRYSFDPSLVSFTVAYDTPRLNGDPVYRGGLTNVTCRVGDNITLPVASFSDPDGDTVTVTYSTGSQSFSCDTEGSVSYAAIADDGKGGAASSPNYDITILPPSTGIPEPIQANNGGYYLGGAADLLALEALADTLEQNVAKDDVDSDGFISTRIEGSIHPAATVSEVNAALKSVSGSIGTMTPGILYVTIIIPAVSDVAEAKTLAQDLKNSGAFIAAFPSYGAKVNLAPDHWSPSRTEFDHLELIKAPSVWNLKRYLEKNPPTGSDKVSVFLTDTFPNAASQPSDLININVVGSAFEADYHGVFVASFIGSIFDNLDATPIHPDPAQHLALTGIADANSTPWPTTLKNTYLAIRNEDRFILNTSLGYNDPGEQSSPLYKRAFLALMWNGLVGGIEDKFIHTTASGNDGDRTNPKGNPVDSRITSPFATARYYDNPCDILENPSLQRDGCELTRTATINGWPHSATRLQNVLVVGGLDNSGSIAVGATQAQGGASNDINAVSVHTLGLCNSAGCSGATYSDSGTSYSSPQIAALASLIWSLDGTLSAAQVKEKILATTGANKIADAYLAVLAVDKSETDAPVRNAIINVVDSGASQNRFDELDIKEYVDKLSNGSAQIKDISRWDLNGDGYTGGPNTERFDLNLDGQVTVPAVANLIIDNKTLATYSEAGVTDWQLLCHFAFNDNFYKGDKSKRNMLLINHLSNCGLTLKAVSLEIKDATGWQTPKTVQLTSFSSPSNSYFGSFTSPSCNGERGGYSSQPSSAFAFFRIPTLVTDVPAPDGTFTNYRGCSNFMHIKTAKSGSTPVPVNVALACSPAIGSTRRAIIPGLLIRITPTA